MQHEGLAPGTLIAGKYLVERTLGRGGMGAVYVVSHASTGKRLAMKCLLAELVQHADLVSRFLREAQVMGRLHHRHVVDVFDVGRDGDVLYIVMELLEGKPLSELLHDSSLTLEEALVILLRAMEGVAAAHDHGVIHRDLKPDNIFVCIGASGRLDDPRVLDFGISKLEESAGEQLTRTGIALGTPYYMSIEQLKSQRDLDQRVDVYALGVILYEAITGEPPYMADSVSALAIKVITTEPLHLAELRPDLPAGLADVIMKALARDRDDRQRSVRALIEALRPFVPKSAGLLVPEGQGRPLRTPRSHTRGAATPAERRRPSPARASDHAVLQELASSPSAGSPELALAIATPTQGNLAARWPRQLGLTLAIVALSGGAAWLARRAPAQPPSERVAATHTPVLSQRLPASLPSSAAASVATRASDAGATLLGAVAPSAPPPLVATQVVADATDAAILADASEPEPTLDDVGVHAPSHPSAQPTTSAPLKTATRAPVADKRSGAPRVTPAIAPAATRKSAAGRAGMLGSDEF